ncbi:MAG: tetratricopeptide repeat protein [Paludibacteraceae bacterium]|nr:tetratricopeptide repeat protein [Paludibacteraceae bacterium]
MKKRSKYNEETLRRYEEGLRFGVSCWLDAEEVEDLFQYYLENDQLSRAEQVYKHGLRLHPDDEYLPLLGIHLLLEHDKPREALDALDAKPMAEDFYWHYLRLGALADMERWEEAEQEGDSIILQEQDMPLETAVDVAHVFMDRDQLLLTLKYLKRAEAIEPSDEEVLLDTARCLGMLERNEEALVYAERLIDLQPYNATVWNLKASLLLALNRNEEALEAVDYALAIEPDNEMMIIGKIKVLTLLDRDEEALRLISETEREQPHMQQMCYSLRGDILFWQQKYKEAEKVYRKGFDTEFFLSDSAMRYLECMMQLKQWRSAFRFGKRLLQVMGDDLLLLEKMSDTAYELNDMSTALQMLRRALRQQPDSTYLLLRYGSLQLDAGDTAAAYRAIHKAWRLMPEDKHTNIMMAFVCCLKKQYKAMHRYLKQACKQDPKALDTFLSLYPDAKNIIEP